MPEIIKPFEQQDQEPQAFPVGLVPLPGQVVVQQGMTLRDWFAGQAGATMFTPGGDYDDGNNEFLKALANDAYAYADAMIEARKRK